MAVQSLFDVFIGLYRLVVDAGESTECTQDKAIDLHSDDIETVFHPFNQRKEKFIGNAQPGQ